MLLPDPAALGAARATANATFTGGIQVQVTTSVRGDDIGDEEVPSTVATYKGRMRLLKATETPVGMRVEGREVYEFALPAGAEVTTASSLKVGSRSYSVLGLDDAPLGGEIQRRVFAERS